MQRLITKALTTAVATAALIATAFGIASADNGQNKLPRQASSNVHTLSACWPGQECWGSWA
ncbi:hypothetical protein OG250_44065 [Streptomyces sp. NBC_00487]|uniref:hypothetical protein n=1 Tax=unclassified Streptomyces TaxID=2593676 RepID=UPI002E18654C|nr:MULTISPECIES: hypothetical protein [unclassified Streptomyces]